MRGMFVIAGRTGSSGYDAARNHNAPAPVRQWQPPGGWTRSMTPGNLPSTVFACHGRDGIDDNQDSSSSPFVVADDPECAS